MINMYKYVRWFESLRFPDVALAGGKGSIIVDVTKYVRWFETLRAEDVPLVGGKNASLGEMISRLKEYGIRVP